MSEIHEWESTLAKFEDPIDKLGYLFGLTHYSLESGADCYVEIKKLLPVVHARCESLRDRIETLEIEKACLIGALKGIALDDICLKHGKGDPCNKYIAEKVLSGTTPSLLLVALRAAEKLDKDRTWVELALHPYGARLLQELSAALRAYRTAMNGNGK